MAMICSNAPGVPIAHAPAVAGGIPDVAMGTLLPVSARGSGLRRPRTQAIVHSKFTPNVATPTVGPRSNLMSTPAHVPEQVTVSISISTAEGIR
jgi:hypothetical protein